MDDLDPVIFCYLQFRSGEMSFVLPWEILVSAISSEAYYLSSDMLQSIEVGKSLSTRITGVRS